MITENDLVFISDMILDDGTVIKMTVDGISCSHNNFKKTCMDCMKHYSKDFPLLRKLYEINERYLNSPFCIICKERMGLITNPLETKEGFVHRQCWMKQTLKGLGLSK